MIKLTSLAVAAILFLSSCATPVAEAEVEEPTMRFRATCSGGVITSVQVGSTGAGVWVLPIVELMEKCRERHEKNSV